MGTDHQGLLSDKTTEALSILAQRISEACQIAEEQGAEAAVDAIGRMASHAAQQVARRAYDDGYRSNPMQGLVCADVLRLCMRLDEQDDKHEEVEAVLARLKGILRKRAKDLLALQGAGPVVPNAGRDASN